MPDPTQVSILKRDGSKTYYFSYALARAAAVEGDLIQIWADLNEQIILLDKVDIWVSDGVVLDFNPPSLTVPPGPTITDNNQAVECKIYGMGVIKNTYDIAPSPMCLPH